MRVPALSTSFSIAITVACLGSTAYADDCQTEMIVQVIGRNIATPIATRNFDRETNVGEADINVNAYSMTEILVERRQIFASGKLQIETQRAVFG